MLLFLIFTLVNADDEFFTLGLDTNFNIVPDMGSLCTNETCYTELCDKLNHNDTCVSYVAYVPLAITLNCTSNFENSKFERKVDMIVFGIDQERVLVTTNICNSVGDCLFKGCNMYNKFANMTWILYTGRCL